MSLSASLMLLSNLGLLCQNPVCVCITSQSVSPVSLPNPHPPCCYPICVISVAAQPPASLHSCVTIQSAPYPLITQLPTPFAFLHLPTAWKCSNKVKYRSNELTHLGCMWKRTDWLTQRSKKSFSLKSRIFHKWEHLKGSVSPVVTSVCPTVTAFHMLIHCAMNAYSQTVQKRRLKPQLCSLADGHHTYSVYLPGKESDDQ